MNVGFDTIGNAILISYDQVRRCQGAEVSKLAE